LNPFGILLFWLLIPWSVEGQEIPPLTHTLVPYDAGPAPALALPDLDDEILDISAQRGKVLLINFWATWCPPCRREMPALTRLADLTRDSDIEVITVNVGEDLETIFSFTGSLQIDPDFPFLIDSDAGTLETWGIKGLPTSFVVDKNGNLAYRAVGGREFDHPDIIAALRALEGI
jgi:thiol-disulfide isomerase/thioredoxin